MRIRKAVISTATKTVLIQCQILAKDYHRTELFQSFNFKFLFLAIPSAFKSSKLHVPKKYFKCLKVSGKLQTATFSNTGDSYMLIEY